MIDACVRLNPKLRLSPAGVGRWGQSMALHAVTRLDVSDNDLTELPDSIFQMRSLKFICLSQNKLEFLPKAHQYNCPWLEEMQLQVRKPSPMNLCLGLQKNTTKGPLRTRPNLLEVQNWDKKLGEENEKG